MTPANKDLASNLCDQDSNIKSDANVNSIEMQGFVDASSIDRFKMLKSDSKIPPKSESQKVIELNVKEKTLMFEQRRHLSEYNFNSTNLSSKSMPDEDDRKSKCSKVESTVTEINENSGRKLENARMNVIKVDSEKIEYEAHKKIDPLWTIKLKNVNEKRKLQVYCDENLDRNDDRKLLEENYNEEDRKLALIPEENLQENSVENTKVENW